MEDAITDNGFTLAVVFAESDQRNRQNVKREPEKRQNGKRRRRKKGAGK